MNYNTAAPPTTQFQHFCSPLPTSGTAQVQVGGKTVGKFVVETPEWQYGGRAELNFDPVTVGIQAKHVTSRYATDVNVVLVKGYTTVDLDARFNLDFVPGKKTYVQLNVHQPAQRALLRNPVDDDQRFGDGASARRFTPVSTRAVTGTLTVCF